MLLHGEALQQRHGLFEATLFNVIPQSFITDLLNRVDIVDVVGRYVQLKKGGANYMGLCPFHNEKSPSFTVSPTKQFYHCFGCGEGGDVLDFVQKVDHLTFAESVERLAGKLGLELMPTRSWDEIVAMVGEAAKKARPGQWIVGRGWHQEKWTKTPSPNVEGFPLHASLDAVSPNNPVILTHASGHASFANGMALRLSNVTKDTPNPNGGEILRDKDGNPTGLLRERASGLIRRGAGEPAPTAEEIATRNRRVIDGLELAGVGVVTVHHLLRVPLVAKYLIIKNNLDHFQLHAHCGFQLRPHVRKRAVASDAHHLAFRVRDFGAQRRR